MLKTVTRVIAGAAVLGLSQLLAPHARAWGVEGHKIIAAIAVDHLDPAVHQQAEALLQAAGLQNMIEVAPWADQYRFSHRESGPWHFVDIPLSAPTFDAARDCHEESTAGEETCVVARVNDFEAVLADRTRPAEERGTALAFLIHLVGDLHQPLHCTDHGDRGGNAVQVEFHGSTADHGRPRNMHAAWDTYMIEDWYGHRAPTDVAQFIDAGQPNIVVAAPRVRQEIISWANESHRYAVDVAYGNLPAGRDPEISGSYEAAAKPVIDHQLDFAGRRLAALITAALSAR